MPLLREFSSSRRRPSLLRPGAAVYDGLEAKSKKQSDFFPSDCDYRGSQSIDVKKKRIQAMDALTVPP
ncbi:hypothetical protein CfE428DRAFT_5557 [Chthoniobacter flavus Ellin428]|uniref:Uncharacterized protein n=1 Tax=Chthoniobacter flavus Ellin428 TaxID=497964 RepID=B4D9G7_9BACT|nr:hypothetical protein CfE428DRAFT_5557 [Chthoniobacter flavus Ellin428]TCO87807.1 hypothetical protein EV701_120106 [Chthoniobacter flavus]